VVPPGRTPPPAWVERLQALALPIFGSRRVVRARAVLDRFNAGGGGLLAAGIAYNTLFALIPLLLFAGGLIGFAAGDTGSLDSLRDTLTDWVPPLSGVVDELLGSLASSSPSLSIIGFIGLAWGSTRLFASLETGIEAMFADVPRRGLVSRTIRRVLSIAVIAAVVSVAIVANSVASIVSEIMVGGGDVTAYLASLVVLALPVVFTAIALASIYRLLPPIGPGVDAYRRPTLVIALALTLLTRLFALFAPRILGANFVYGTLGAIFVALAWLGLTYSLILVGAAWVRERMLAETEPPPIA
jgi:YihY family inner membrane protein